MTHTNIRLSSILIAAVALMACGIIMASCGGGHRDHGDRGGWFTPSGG